MAQDPEQKRRTYRKRLLAGYGLTLGDYERMLFEQDERCAICESPECDSTHSLAVDHDHQTGKVRGLLCRRCNQVLGKMEDDPALLEAAAAYLKRSREREGG